MFHIFRHTKGKLKGKFDFAFIANGNFICGSSPQGHDRKATIYKDLRALAKATSGITVYVQDDTEGMIKPTVYLLTWYKNTFQRISTKKKPQPVYQP